MYLSGRKQIEVPATRRDVNPAKRKIIVRGASGFNLKNVDVEIPLGVFNCITGVSGSGKSTLLNKTLAPEVRHQLGLISTFPATFESIHGLEHVDRLVQVDQKGLGRSSRGCAATYTGIMDEVRKIYARTKEAKQMGFTASRFSFNSKAGNCPQCTGHGQCRVKMSFLPDVFVRCPACLGRRFNQQTLQVRFRGMTIADVLNLPINQALQEFENIESIRIVLECLDAVGLGYLSLGQPSSSLSGGEAQRIKLARELSRPDSGHTLYLMDEPTTGLHFEDVSKLLNVIFRLVEIGNTVIVIEHNLDVIKCADWIIDLGPEGGSAGGEIVAAGSPEDIVKHSESHTARYLSKLLS